MVLSTLDYHLSPRELLNECKTTPDGRRCKEMASARDPSENMQLRASTLSRGYTLTDLFVRASEVLSERASQSKKSDTSDDAFDFRIRGSTRHVLADGKSEKISVHIPSDLLRRGLSNLGRVDDVGQHLGRGNRCL